MEIILGKTAGFCYGVKNAIDGVEKKLNINNDIYCLGEIVHNKNVVKKLQDKGIKFVNNVEEAQGTTIIRAHGASKQIYEKLQNKKIKIIDLTCPNVLKTHEIAKQYIKKNFFIVLIGIKNHPESNATLSFCEKNSYLVQDFSDIHDVIEKIHISKLSDILIMAQTTYNSKKFDEIASILQESLKEYNIEIKKTICGATEIRQNETREISKKVDGMIIIGDKKSSNTNKLYDISKESCSKVYLVENSSQLDINEIKNFKKIGIMAGASTPDTDINEIIEKIRSI